MSEQREAQRRRVCFAGRIVHARVLSDTACVLANLSDSGARLRVSRTVPLPDRFDLVIACPAAAHRAEIVWRYEDAIGVRFLPAIMVDDCDAIAALRRSVEASRAETAALRARLDAFAPESRGPGETLH